MNLVLKRINDQIAFEAVNEEGKSQLFDGAPQFGGQGLGMRPMESLAASLAACVSMDILLILRKKRMEPAFYEVHISAARKAEMPKSFTLVRLDLHVDKKLDLETVQRVADMSLENYCSVASSLSHEVVIEMKVVPV